MRIAVLVKQVPRFEDLTLGEDGRLRRTGVEPELNPYCRRAVAEAVLLTRAHGGSATVLTVGPPAAADVLREAIAWGCDDGVLVSDPALAGSDTLATARALAAALRRLGSFDLVLCGRNSIDADTGQVGPAVAELLQLPFAGPARALDVGSPGLELLLERDDGTERATVTLPAVVSCAERLCDPAKVDDVGRAAVDGHRIRSLTAADLGAGPWGAAGSPTRVGRMRSLAVARAGTVLDGPVAAQAARAVELLARRGALDPGPSAVPVAGHADAGDLRGPAVVVISEPGTGGLTAELIGAAARLAAEIGGHVLVVGAGGPRGGDAELTGDLPAVAEDAADVVHTVCAGGDGAAPPWAVLLPATAWGREVGARVAVRLGAGLVGDAVELDVEDGRLVAWKPALGGSLVVAVTCTSAVQLVTLRPGVLPASAGVPSVQRSAPLPTASHAGRVQLSDRVRDDDLETLVRSPVVIGVGGGVEPGDYPYVEPLRRLLGAELAASRRVTDRGWLPRSRQVGITGRSLSPRLYIALGIRGTFNHTVGWRAAASVLAVNSDPSAPVFASADVGITASWQDAVVALEAALRAHAAEPAPAG